MRENVLTANPTTRVRNIPLTEKVRAVEVKQGEPATIEFDLRTADGKALNLTEYGFEEAQSSSSSAGSGDSSPSSSSSAAEETPEIRLLVGEFIGGSSTPLVETTGEVVAAAKGKVRATVPTTITDCAGIYAAEWGVHCGGEPADGVSVSDRFYLHVQRGLRGRNAHNGKRRGPPTASEIRLHLRDTAPEESYLLDHLSWDAAELAEAIASAVDVWNEMLPPIRTYTTQNYPYRLAWINGVIAILFRMAAEWYQRNDLQYAAAGTQVADMRKWQWYKQEGDKRWQEYKDWVQKQKIAVNLNGGFGGVGSDYGRFSGGTAT